MSEDKSVGAGAEVRQVVPAVGQVYKGEDCGFVLTYVRECCWIGGEATGWEVSYDSCTRYAGPALEEAWPPEGFEYVGDLMLVEASHG